MSTITVNVQGEIRFPDLAQLAHALEGRPAASVLSAAQPAAAAPATAAPKFTIDDLARAGAELAQQGPDKLNALNGLLTQFGLQSVTQLRPDQLAPFATAMRGLGARL